MLKLRLLCSTAALFAFVPLASLAAPPQGAPVKPTAEGLAKAKTLYQIDCSMCHGDNGDGKSDLATSMSLKLSDWTNPASLSSADDQTLFDIIRKGKDKMPPEETNRAPDATVWNLIAYIRSFSKTAAAK